MKFAQLILGLSCLALAGPSAAAPKKNANVPEVSWRQSPIVVMPGLLPAGERRVKDEETFIELPLRWAKSTRLETDVKLTLDNSPFVIPSGEHLPFVVIKSGLNSQRRFAYCVRNKVIGTVDKNTTKGPLFGLVPTDKKFRQVCLEDRDNNGSFEKAILLSMVSGITDLSEIEPVSYKKLEFEIIDESTDNIRIFVDNISDKHAYLVLTLKINGRKIRFTTWHSGRYSTYSFGYFYFAGKKKGPNLMLGINIEAIDGNEGENWVLMRWKPIMRQNEIIPVPEQVKTTWSFNFY